MLAKMSLKMLLWFREHDITAYIEKFEKYANKYGETGEKLEESDELVQFLLSLPLTYAGVYD